LGYILLNAVLALHAVFVCVKGPTMKLKRQVVTKMYEKEINALYAEAGGDGP